MNKKMNILSPKKLVLTLVLLIALGCQSQPNPFYEPGFVTEPRTIAIAPFLNQSGSEYLVPMAVTDAFYSELQSIEGLTVVHPNRIMTEMMNLGIETVSSPQDALSLADQLHADAIIVGAITAYDPYPPPEIGMKLQLYAREIRSDINANGNVDPGDIVRQPTSFDMPFSPELKPRVGLTRIFDADRQDVVEEIKKYASIRTGQQRPHSWRYYTTQANFIRFVSYQMIGDLLTRERDWLRVNH
ncbi:MAG: hypothetical protein GY869_13475 [Planctomycetes bacterium]|nr:hypothetical protein [Planctomycetota bacterium]